MPQSSRLWSSVDLLSSSRQHSKIIWPKTSSSGERRSTAASSSTLRRRKRRTPAAMTTEDNGNVGLLKPTSSSNEDLSEYTDADESISAPTEFLAEFLSAVMMKDYVTALKYCKLILQYEPNNATAKEFYPLILEKLQQTLVHSSTPAANNDDASSSDVGEDDGSEENGTSSTSSDSESSSSSEDSSEGQEEEEEEEEAGGRGDKESKGSSDGDATTGSYSSLEDDEAETTDQLAALAAKYRIDNVNLGNGNKIYGTLPTFDDNYSPIEGDNNVIASSKLPFGTSSDSESPTEPVSQQTVQMAAMLRARVVPNKH